MTDEIMLQEMINFDLKALGKKSVAEVLEEHGKKEEPGVITSHHKLALQQLIRVYAKSNDINIDEEIKNNEKGKVIKQTLGKFTKTEKKYIDKLLTEYQENIEYNKEKVA